MRIKVLIFAMSFMTISCSYYRNAQGLVLDGRIFDAPSYILQDKKDVGLLYYSEPIRTSDFLRYRIQYLLDDRLSDNCDSWPRLNFISCHEGLVNVNWWLQKEGYNNPLRKNVFLQIVLVEEYTGEVFPLGNYQTHFLDANRTEVRSVVYVGEKEYSARDHEGFNVVFSESLQDSIFYQTCVYARQKPDGEMKLERCF